MMPDNVALFATIILLLPMIYFLLAAPKGPFSMIMRLYWPKEAATEGKWKQPPLQQVI